MAEYSQEELIKSYWEASKEEILKASPSMTFEHFRFICKTPFVYAKEQMSSPELPMIRFTHLGYFRVSRASVFEAIDNVKAAYIKGEVTREYTLERIQFLRDYLKMISK